MRTRVEEMRSECGPEANTCRSRAAKTDALHGAGTLVRVRRTTLRASRVALCPWALRRLLGQHHTRCVERFSHW